MLAAADDWRRTSPGAPRGTRFGWREYVAPTREWDHDHCLFCWAKFVPRSEEGKEWPERDDHTNYFKGYATAGSGGPGFEWVCRPCFDDFADELDFVVVADDVPDDP